MWGARVSLGVGVLATLVSLTIGVSYGAVAGYLGGRADHLMMRLVDVLYGLPFMFFVIILMVVLGRNIFNLFIALGAHDGADRPGTGPHARSPRVRGRGPGARR